VTRHMRRGSMLAVASIDLTGPPAGNGSNPTSMKLTFCPLDLHGVAGTGVAVHRPPAVEGDRLLGVECGDVGGRPHRDRVGTGQGELGVLGQQLQYRPVQPGTSDPGPQGTVQVSRGPAAPVVAAPLEGRVAAEGMPEPAQAVQVEPAAQQPGHVGGKPLELVDHRGQVGGLVVADRRPLAEPLLIWAVWGPRTPACASGLTATTRPSANTVTAGW
jgi:hypothetical protein